MTWTPGPLLDAVKKTKMDALPGQLVQNALELAVAGFPTHALRVWELAYLPDMPEGSPHHLDRCAPVVMAALTGAAVPEWLHRGLPAKAARPDAMTMARQTDAFIRDGLLRVADGRPVPDAPTTRTGWVLHAMAMLRAGGPAEVRRGVDVLVQLVGATEREEPWTSYALILAADGLALRGDDDLALRLLQRIYARPDAQPRVLLSLLPLAKYHVDGRYRDAGRTEADVAAFVVELGRVVAGRLAASEAPERVTHRITTLDNYFNLEPKETGEFADHFADPKTIDRGWSVIGREACISMPGEVEACDVTLVFGPGDTSREPVHRMAFSLDVEKDLYIRTSVDDVRLPVPGGRYDVEVAFLSESLEGESDMPTWEVELRLTKASAAKSKAKAAAVPVAPAEGARRFEFVEGTSSKFWEVSVDGASFTVRYGKIGTDGVSKTKACKAEAEAQAEAGKLVREKTGKGYVEVTE